MDEIKDTIQAARAQRIAHMTSQFQKFENDETEEKIQKGMATPEDDGVDYDAEAEREEAEERKEAQKENKEIEDTEEQSAEETEKSENERIFEKGIMGAELTPEEGAEMTELTKSDIMYAFSEGHDAIKLTKTGAEIKQQIQDVVRPELVTRLGSLKAQADEKLKDCGVAPTELPDPYMTGGVAMDCGYKRYPWDATYFNENDRQESITAEDDENKNGLRPESKEQAMARREYNDLVYQMYNVCADLKALELLSQVKDKKNYDLTPRQAACLKF